MWPKRVNQIEGARSEFENQRAGIALTEGAPVSSPIELAPQAGRFANHRGTLPETSMIRVLEVPL